MLFHFHRLPRRLPTPLDLLHEADKVVERAGPGAVGAPPAEILVLAGLAHEHLRLLPEVLVHGLLAASLQELEPPVQPRRRRRVPRDAAVGLREEELPLLRRDLERQVALALQPAQRERVAVDPAEDVGLRCDARAELSCVGNHLLERIAAVVVLDINPSR